MTGAVSEKVCLKDRVGDPEKLWSRMMTCNDGDFGPLLTAGIGRLRDSKKECGLKPKHAYSVTAVREPGLDGERYSIG